MGRKSSAKSQTRPPSSTEPPSGPTRSVSPLLGVALVALVTIVGALVYARAGRGTAVAEAPALSAHTDQNAADSVQRDPAAVLKPHKQANLPPLPFQAYAPPRPAAVVRAAYVFAAEHPEVLSYVPCFCGCERGGHKGNDDCFVARRAPNGDVVEWEPHGLDCAVCIDVATYAQQLHSSGASLADIRNAVEKRWAGASAHGTHTPTPLPPKS